MIENDLKIELTLSEIYRIAKILDGRFEGKTLNDVDLSIKINSALSTYQKKNLDEIVEIQESKQDFWDKSRKLLYSYGHCLVCGCQFCQCG